MRAEPRSGVLLYTDGLTEARRNGELFGRDRVTAALAALAEDGDATPEQAVGALRTSVAEFAPGPLRDDLCLLAARIE